MMRDELITEDDGDNFGEEVKLVSKGLTKIEYDVGKGDVARKADGRKISIFIDGLKIECDVGKGNIARKSDGIKVSIFIDAFSVSSLCSIVIASCV